MHRMAGGPRRPLGKAGKKAMKNNHAVICFRATDLLLITGRQKKRLKDFTSLPPADVITSRVTPEL
jgi:hypothetical protein